MGIYHFLLLAAGVFFASTLAVVAGFGGAAVLLPMLVLVFGVRDALIIGLGFLIVVKENCWEP